MGGVIVTTGTIPATALALLSACSLKCAAVDGNGSHGVVVDAVAGEISWSISRVTARVADGQNIRKAVVGRVHT